MYSYRQFHTTDNYGGVVAFVSDKMYCTCSRWWLLPGNQKFICPPQEGWTNRSRATTTIIMTGVMNCGPRFIISIMRLVYQITSRHGIGTPAGIRAVYLSWCLYLSCENGRTALSAVSTLVMWALVNEASSGSWRRRQNSTPLLRLWITSVLRSVKLSACVRVCSVCTCVCACVCVCAHVYLFVCVCVRV